MRYRTRKFSEEEQTSGCRVEMQPRRIKYLSPQIDSLHNLQSIGIYKAGSTTILRLEIAQKMVVYEKFQEQRRFLRKVTRR